MSEPIHIQDKPAECQAGFLDAIGVYVLITLEGVLVRVRTARCSRCIF